MSLISETDLSGTVNATLHLRGFFIFFLSVPKYAKWKDLREYVLEVVPLMTFLCYVIERAVSASSGVGLLYKLPCCRNSSENPPA